MQENQIYRESIKGIEGKKILQKGLNKSCNIVTSTMGARGSNNIFETQSRLPHVTSDGKDSLMQLFWVDPIENLALQIVKEACEKTFDVIGDGTTTTCALVQSFFNNSLEELEKGGDAIEIKENIDKSVVKILEYLDSIAVPLTPKLMFDVAKTSAHGDESIAKIIVEAFEKAGEHGIVSHKRSFTDETYIDHIEGNPIESGYSHEAFINVPESQSVVFDNPLVVVSTINFQTIQEVIPFIKIADSKKQPLLIISNMSEDLKNAIIANVKNEGFPICIINPPYIGKKGRETMNDIALVLNCDVLEGISRSDYSGKEETFLGSCQRIVVDKKNTVITRYTTASKELIDAKINELNKQVSLQDQDLEKNYLKERISKLSGGICTIMVGGITPSETEERIARVDDAIASVRSAKEGVIAGGGIALFSASFLEGIDKVTLKSLKSPLYKILENANVKHNLKSNWIKSNFLFKKAILSKKDVFNNIGYDVKNYKKINMFEAGIIDTVKGAKASLLNSVSASNNLSRTDNIITFKRMENGK